MKIRFLAPALMLSASTGAIAANCEKNPTHPQCGGTSPGDDLTARVQRLEDRLANSDFDFDGYTPAGGDCDDSNPEVNPAAYEYAGTPEASDGIDNDCDGVIDNAVVNTPPTAPEISMVPAAPITSDALQCTIDVHSMDADGDTVGYIYTWRGNGSVDFAEISSSLPASKTIKGDEWECTVTPNDGIEDGPPAVTSVIIENAPPTAPGISIVPAVPVATNDLLCTIVAPSVDADGDGVSYAYSWQRNGTPVTESTPVVSASLTAAGDNWECTVTPNDGIEDGPPAVTSVVIN